MGRSQRAWFGSFQIWNFFTHGYSRATAVANAPNDFALVGT